MVLHSLRGPVWSCLLETRGGVLAGSGPDPGPQGRNFDINFTTSLLGRITFLRYTFVDLGKPPPPAPNVNGTMDIQGFAPGTILPTPPGNTTQGVRITPLDQLKTFPDPRYKSPPKPEYALGRNFDWMAPNYMARVPGDKPNVTDELEMAIITELATTYR